MEPRAATAAADARGDRTRVGWRNEPERTAMTQAEGAAALLSGDPPPFERGLDRNAANFVPLSPVGFVERSALVYPRKVAIRHGRLAFTYAEFHERCRRLASALARRGIRSVSGAHKLRRARLICSSCP